MVGGGATAATWVALEVGRVAGKMEGAGGLRTKKGEQHS